jgi:hypothetical protein
VNWKSARSRFAAALALYVIWIGALVAMAVVSGARPVERPSRTAPAETGGAAVPRD